MNNIIYLYFAVKVEQKGKTLEISAEYKPSPRESILVKEVKSEKKFCPKCTLGLDIKHTDVLILKQYLRSDGTMMPRRVTGLCAVQQKNIGTMVLMARRAGALLIYTVLQFFLLFDTNFYDFFVFFIGLLALPSQLNSKKQKKCMGYMGLNHYYDEKTIKYARLKINE